MKSSNQVWEWNSKKMKALVISVMFSILILNFFRILTGPPIDSHWLHLPQEKLHIEEDFNLDVEMMMGDKLLGGLLLDGLDESSCASRYQSYVYGRRSRSRQQRHRPSPYLISRLRKYEQLQKQCGPNTDHYNKTVQNLKSGTNVTYESACKYVIFSTPFRGLGNRMLTVGATFLYALLTDRVLLIGNAGHMADLFCEPFPDVSWFLTSDFPKSKLRSSSAHDYGNLLQNGSFRNSNVPLLVYFNLGLTYGKDKDGNNNRFFCDHDQMLLQHVPWLVITSELYFLPSLFLIPSFEKELDNLFPEKETVFHHLGRYLYHPSNPVWGLITSYYDAYLANADEILGIQIRVFPPDYFRTMPTLDQVFACAINENLLPNLNVSKPIIKPFNHKPRTKAVLVTSLSTNYSEEIRNRYWEYAAITGERITVYQPSHDKQQKSQDKFHDRRALAEVYLLSMSDKLVITGMSTFGYAAQSLAGLRPWILYLPRRQEIPNPPCQQALSMEPCFHYAPAFYSCQNTKPVNTTYHVSYVQNCEDFNVIGYESLKLIDQR